MYSKEVQVTNQVGLYARPATFFIQKANEFKSTILVEKEERRVNAKSLLGILSLGITKGTTINLIADGPDEEEAVSALVELITSRSPGGYPYPLDTGSGSGETAARYPRTRPKGAGSWYKKPGARPGFL